MMPALLGAVAGVAAAPLLLAGAIRAAATIARRAPNAGMLAAARLERVLRPLRDAGELGLVPADAARLRLQAAAAATGLALGLAIAGVALAIGFAALSAWGAARALVWRRERYRRRLDAGTAPAALALADALAAGHSVRGAVMVVAPALDGPIAVELRRLARDLEAGASAADALHGLRARCRSRRIDVIVAAIRLQSRSGGSLAALLRDTAAAIESQQQLEQEARSASAQARFTSFVVVALPMLALVLGELASPGFTIRLLGSNVARVLMIAAVLLQLLALALVARLSRVEG